MERENSFQRLEVLYDTIPCAIMHFSPEEPCPLLSANREALHILHLEQGESYVGGQIITFVHPDFQEYVQNILQQARQSGQKLCFEVPLILRGGLRAWIRGTVILARDVDGQSILQCAFNDITEQKNLQCQVENERERYRLALEIGDDVVFEYEIATDIFRRYKNILQPDGSVVHSTEVCENYIHTICTGDRVHPADRENVLAIICKGQERDANQRLHRLTDPAGVYRWFAIRGSQVCENGSPVRVIGTIRDVDEQKFLTAIVKRFAYDNSEHFIFVDALSNSYTMYGKNDSGAPLPPTVSCDYSAEVRKFAENAVVDKDCAAFVAHMQLDTVLEHLEKEGEYIFYVGVTDPLRGYTHKKFHFSYYDRVKKMILLTRSDVTHMYNEEEQKNAQLREALETAKQASNAKTAFLSRISHDIRTPLNTIMGMTAIAELRLDNRGQVRDCLSKINTASQYLLSLINAILDMSRIESGKMLLVESTFNLESFLHDIAQQAYPQARDKGLNFQILVREPLDLWYVADPLRIQQVLMNLLSNAIRFNHLGGQVLLELGAQKSAAARCVLDFSVRDTGIGISPEFLKKIFEPFEQENNDYARNQVGSGLGLPIVQNFVDLMGGDMEIVSQPGKGTCVCVSLPLTVARQCPNPDDPEAVGQTAPSGQMGEALVAGDLTQAEEALQQPLPPLKNVRALVVCSEPLKAQSWTRMLTSLGLRVERADTGESAVDKLRMALVEQKGFAVALVSRDLSCGDRPCLDGVETVAQLRALSGPEQLEIFFAAYAWQDVEKEAREAGVNHFLAQPLFWQSLRQTFVLWLEKGVQTRRIKQPRRRFAGQHVMLVEDNEINQEIGKMLLEEEGLAVDTANNGLEAVELFSKRPVEYYILILMDIRMPVLDGLVATTKIRALGRPDADTVPIVAMTANAFQEDMETALAAGMNNYLTKPVNPEKLYQTIEWALTLSPDSAH